MKKILHSVIFLTVLTLLLPARWFFPELAAIAPDPCIFPESSSLRIR